MNIRDIVNRDIVNLTNCEHEPIHIPGSIQPHGFLLAIEPASHTIVFCSGNTDQYIGQTPSQLLGKDLETAFGDTVALLFGQYIGQNLILSAAPLQMVFNDMHFLCSIHHNGSVYVLEAEPAEANPKNLTDVYSQTVQFVSYMNNTNTLKELCTLVAKGTREMTGYDRVMVYRFDKEYNGEVFAEDCREDLEPFLGLHYPHTDIPVQARELYMRNLLRIIVDINYKPVPIYTIDETGTHLDLSISVLRSTSPIHVEYLQNMGVGATLTISLVHRGRLWGLIACHHYSPKNITPEIRLAAQLQGQFITSQIDVRQSNEEYDISRKTNIALEKMNGLNLPPIDESFKIISVNPELLKLCNAAGVSMLIGGHIYSSGLVPGAQDIRMLAAWLANHSNQTNFFSDKIAHYLPELAALSTTVSGVIYHSLDNGNCIIWYRPETQTEVHWGGDPNKAIVKDQNGLHPRNSFNLWKQIVKNRSKDWLQPELNAAANYAHTLQKQIGFWMLSQEEEKYRSLTEVLKATNAELENINWISTHDLQEPLRKIQLISSRLFSKEDEHFSQQTLDALHRINNSANRMQTLLIDILKYTRIKYSKDAFETVDLNEVIDEILRDLQEMARELNADITRDVLPKIDGVPFLLKQLFSNIILNALKYAAAHRKPVLKITSLGTAPNPFDKNSMCHVVRLQDNGIGFEAKYAESIFHIFTRLHSTNEYKGSGVGLALCRKIMQTHGGSITASGLPDQGAVFTLYFPVIRPSQITLP